MAQQYVFDRLSIDEYLVLDRNLNGDSDATGPGDQRLFFHQNTLRSVYALTDTAGQIKEGYQYDAYGQRTAFAPGGNNVVDFGGDDLITANGLGATQNPYGFTGRRLDPETKMYYYRSRYMDPDAGRFISRDKIGIWADGANVGNGYAYVGNNPVGLVDPFGRHTTESEIAACKELENLTHEINNGMIAADLKLELSDYNIILASCTVAVTGICAVGCIPSLVGYLICFGLCSGLATTACITADQIARGQAEARAEARKVTEAVRHKAAILACNKIVIPLHCHPKPP